MLRATLAGCFIACVLLFSGLAARAQPEPPARSVVLKPVSAPARLPVAAPPHGDLLALQETRAPRLWLDSSTRSAGDQPPRDRWLAFDKAKHLGGGFLVVLGSQYVFEEKAALRRDPALALSLGTGVAVSLGKEAYDRWAGPTRYFSAKDLVADALGVLLGAGVVML